MNLQELIQEYNNDLVTLDEYNIKLSDILFEKKYSVLLDFLNKCGIIYSNDLKKMSQHEYDRLKVKLPEQPGIGEFKTDLYFKKLDEVRKNSNSSFYKKANTNNSNDDNDLVYIKLIGKIRINLSYTIDLNILKYKDGSEYLDIRKVKTDGTRKNGISIKKDNISEFVEILNKNLSDYLEHKPVMVKEEETNYELVDRKLDDDKNIQLEDMIENIFDYRTDSIKKEILDNEIKLLNKLDKRFSLSIKLFIKKIESLSNDGDIYKFLKNDGILDNKEELYNEIHKKGLKTAVDIIDKYEPTSLHYTTLENLEIGDSVNTMTLCAIANNFNHMLGMYYNEKEDFIILKSQISDGDYNNQWLGNGNMLYYLQNETSEKYQTLEFSHKPNQVCRDIILNINSHTRVYLFNRNNRKETYKYCGEVKPIKFSNSNKCIVIKTS